jgi:tetratricopeptide (TPR) repeat protein
MRLDRPTTKIALAILAPLVFFLALGGVLRLTGLFGPPRLLQKIHHNGQTYFTADPDFVRTHSDHESQSSSAHPPVWVAADKPEGVRRIVLLGGSGAAGFPLTDYHLGRLVAARWRAQFPSEPVEVVNLSMAAANSRAWRESAREAMALDPDMVVLYAEDNGSSDREADFRDIVRRALARESKVLFVLPATSRRSEPDENILRALPPKIASDSGPAVAVVDADRWMRGEGGALQTDDAFFPDSTDLTFAGRVALAGLTVDGMAALWGLAPRDGNPEAFAAWWQKFPAAEAEARRDTFFTGYDEHDMWSLALAQWKAANSASPGSAGRLAALEDKVRDLRRRAVLGWDTTDLIVAYERAQLQNPRDPLTHFTAGRLLGLRGEGERAVEAFQRGFALQPNNAAALLNYAAMQMTRGDTASARAALDELQKYDPQAEGLPKMQAAVAMREAELPEAASLLQKHLALNPGDSGSWLTLSEIQLKLGDSVASEASRQKGEKAAAQ